MAAGSNGHRPSGSVSQAPNHKAQLASAYNELGKELSSQKIRVVGNYTLGKVIGEGAQRIHYLPSVESEQLKDSAVRDAYNQITDRS